MANTYLAKGLTGKSTRKMENGFASVLFPIVDQATGLLKQAHPINDTTRSGKQIGAAVVSKNGTKLQLSIAVGSGETADWLEKATASVTDVTPA